MNYLFLDDERVPSDVTWVNIARGVPWEIVRSFNEAVAWVRRHGFPDVISFDHDLSFEHYGGDYTKEKTGYDFAKWLIEYDLDTNTMPEDFSFTVHSMNPVGSRNIKNLLDNYLRLREK
jgi:hypothetical protein